ncbi:MAG: hypothetical protein AAGJ46_12095 [Planctomycetota bacterium]
MSDEEDSTHRRLRRLEGLQQRAATKGEEMHRRLDHHESCLRSELGLDSDSPGNVNRRATDVADLVDQHDKILRGEGTEIGLIGWYQIMRRTWWGAIAAVGTLIGYIAGVIFPVGN